VGVAIDETRHHDAAMAIDGAGSKPARFSFKFGSGPDADNLRAGGEERAVWDSAELAQSCPATRDRGTGEGQKLRRVSEE
jgi:hypothetical protein